MLASDVVLQRVVFAVRSCEDADGRRSEGVRDGLLDRRRGLHGRHRPREAERLRAGKLAQKQTLCRYVEGIVLTVYSHYYSV